MAQQNYTWHNWMRHPEMRAAMEELAMTDYTGGIDEYYGKKGATGSILDQPHRYMKTPKLPRTGGPGNREIR